MDNEQNILRKTGDDGTSDLLSGQRVSKCSDRLEALGCLDELGSALGLARVHIKDTQINDSLLEIQRNLFVVGAEIANDSDQPLSKTIDQSTLAQLEDKVEQLNKRVAMPKDFVVAGESVSSAYLHNARTIARRSERRVVKLFENEEFKNSVALSFLNRLSVYLYFLAISLTDDHTLAKD